MVHNPDNGCCTGCGFGNPYEFFRTTGSPVNCGSIPKTHAEALAAKTGEIRLEYCRRCGLVFNSVYDVDAIDFQPGYEVSLAHSKTFSDFQSGVVEHLISTFGLNRKKILEIGCGDGSFLKMICQRGENHGIGIDPTVPITGAVKLDSGSVHFIRDFFGEKHVRQIDDFVCSLSVFEDIPTPGAFLSMLRRMIGERRPSIYFEVFNGFRSIDCGEIWSIHYEQCNYFSLPTLENLFRNAGLKVLDSGYCYQQDQYLFVEAIPDLDFDSTRNQRFQSSIEENDSVPSVISEFSKQFDQRISYWEKQLSQRKRDDQRVVLWGSGGKGISFLNSISTSDAIESVVDINPNRQGSFIPGTGQCIIAPDQLVKRPPDLIILTNPIYKKEIQSQVSELGIQAAFEFV